MKKYGQSIVALALICAVVTVMLACVNAITRDRIKENEAAAVSRALLLALPDGGSFEKLDCSALSLPATVTDVYRGSEGGYVFQMTTVGYSSGMVILCGISEEGAVQNALCLSSNETLGKEKTYGASLKGTTLTTVDSVDAVSGATKTTVAYRNAVKDALTAFEAMAAQQRGGEAS